MRSENSSSELSPNQSVPDLRVRFILGKKTKMIVEIDIAEAMIA